MLSWAKRFGSALAAGSAIISLTLAAPSHAQNGDDKKPSALSSLPLRLIGPAYPSGRISDFAFFGDGSHHYIVATASGGLWMTGSGS